jgi:hypothetical protein
VWDADGRLLQHLPGFEVPVDTYYAVIARYTVGVDTILVLNGGRLEVSSETYRDATCYAEPEGGRR